MAYYDYQDGSTVHPGGAKGIRVTGADHKQEYFPNTPKGRAAAKKRDREWQRKDEALRRQRIREAVPFHRKKASFRRMSTGVRGIALVIQPQRLHHYPTISLNLQARGTDGKSYCRSRAIKYEWDLPIAFTQLARVLASIKGLGTPPKEWQCPTYTAIQLNRFIQKAHRNGVDTGLLRIGNKKIEYRNK